MKNEETLPADWCGKTHDDMRQCCCDCVYHLPVHHHCSRDPELRKQHGGCCCRVQKGWACVAPEFGRVYDNWPAHSCGCELHTTIQQLDHEKLP